MNYNETNKKYWDEAAKVHMNAPKGYYDIEGFNRGKSSLKKVHLDELGDLKGKKVLHLLCHIGLDTLSLSRLGAKVTGTDISSNAIKSAQELAKMNNLDAEFICCDVYDLDKHINDKYDIVFASHGVTCWLKDLDKFMNIVSTHLKPDGFFYLMDGHPMSMIMTKEDNEMKVRQNYYDNAPIYSTESEDYADKDIIINKPCYEWHYTLSEIINAICKSGLKLDMLNEHAFCDDNYYGDMIQDSEGWWSFRDKIIPLMFSIKAIKNTRKEF